MDMHAPVLSGYGVRLEQLTLEHAEDLKTACSDGNLGDIFYTSAPYPHTVEAYIQKALEQQAKGERIPFAVINGQTNRAIGSTSYHDIKPEIPRLEIGYTWYAQSFQGTHVNRACKYLLLQHAFETLNAPVVAFRTDHLNLRSQAAIRALGAKQDGILRCHTLRKDGKTVRDTVMFSILQSEWPAVKAKLEDFLKART
ncbi:hypothetical protein GW12_11380 [Acinetobacter sp. HR7]|nr:hypothetical protein GW12_11380 [Acinetobacter sp. HR7]